MERKKKSIAERISLLSNPKPASFHPDEEFLEDETAAKVCDFTYEGGNDRVRLPSAAGVMRARAKKGIELDDPKYAGRIVSRKDLEFEGLYSESDDSSNVSGPEEELLQAALEQRLDEDHMISSEYEGSEVEDSEEESEGKQDRHGSTHDETMSEDEEGGDEGESDEERGEGAEFEEKAAAGDQRQEGGGVSLFAVNNDVEKGKAAREQLRLLDKLLELRIKFHGILALTNRLPSPENMPFFLEEGGPAVKDALNQAHRSVQELLWTFLELQEDFLSQVEGDCDPSVSRAASSGGSSDEEVLSSEEEEQERKIASKEDKRSVLGLSAKSRKRKRKFDSEWDCEAEVESLHSRLRPYRNTVIANWNEKTRLASGKISSKAYIEVDRSTLSQIDQVLADKERLVKRTQLRRSVYHILGEKVVKGDEDTSSQRDAHLHNYNVDVFDDDDFYHQLLKELIERKTSYSESADPIEMGRQWLELQKMRTKAKKKVDTKASKGRKLRYNVHPKLVNFMAPVTGSKFSDASKNDLFSSLFGARYLHRT